ncbi:lasso peptide biosynthesis B2 protein [Hyphomonas sp.]|uniref:lasso peptide biosynthesis B2 protein n=1 Tax=Hyphomonas sp. TaxID=87 RepID=UPI003562362B
MPQAFSLSPDVFYCEFEAAIIILDVSADTYARLTPAQCLWFREILSSEDLAGLDVHAAHFAEHLVDRGLLQLSEASTRLAEKGRPYTARDSLLDTALDAHQTLSLRCLAPFAYAIVSASLLERSHKFKGVIRTARAWKRSALSRPAIPEAQVLAITRAFHALSPLLVTTHEACRFRSLALIRFLSLFGVPADWVFGVRLSPFGAHCWVEHDGIILNDHSDNAFEYTPIMKV